MHLNSPVISYYFHYKDTEFLNMTIFHAWLPFSMPIPIHHLSWRASHTSPNSILMDFSLVFLPSTFYPTTEHLICDSIFQANISFGPLLDSFLLHLWDVKPSLTCLADWNSPLYTLRSMWRLFHYAYQSHHLALSSCDYLLKICLLPLYCKFSLFTLYLKWLVHNLAYCSCLINIYLINE